MEDEEGTTGGDDGGGADEDTEGWFGVVVTDGSVGGSEDTGEASAGSEGVRETSLEDWAFTKECDDRTAREKSVRMRTADAEQRRMVLKWWRGRGGRRRGRRRRRAGHERRRREWLVERKAATRSANSPQLSQVTLMAFQNALLQQLPF